MWSKKSIMKISQLLKKIYYRLFCDKNIYVHKVSKDAPWALVCYIPYVYYQKGNDAYLDQHQSHREAFVIDEVLTSLGYNVYHQTFCYDKPLPDIDFKLIFGLEPLFCKACEKYPNAKKIYYATGAYFEHQNNMIYRLTDEFNAKHNTQIPYRRTVAEHNSCQVADKILQIGSSYTIETYPEDIRKKISLIHQSSQAVRTVEVINYAPENEYFFMSSSGNMLKGVPQMIECFSKHPELTLHILGYMEDDVIATLKDSITPNIHIHGFMNVNSQEYIDIISRCNFTIYPSGSEGGVPGAVLNSMKNGLIPISTKWASYDEINDYGYVMDDVSVEEIEKGIAWTNKMSKEDIIAQKQNCAEYINHTYNLKTFRSEIKTFFLNNL